MKGFQFFYSSNKTASGLPAIEGGSISYSNGDQINTFTSNGTLTVNQETVVELLLVGGGGGGNQGGAGGNAGGGGGGGAVVYSAAYTLPVGTYQVNIGSGGTGSAASFNAAGQSGGSSTLGALLTATGGQTTALGDKSYGNNSGTGLSGGTEGSSGSGVNTNYFGGGGASTLYTVGTSPTGAQGYTSSISGSAVVYGSGGGGGAGNNNLNTVTLSGGSAGTNGGNGGSINTSQVPSNGSNAVNNTGGGGGGAAVNTYISTTYGAGGNGGSGILIIRWRPSGFRAFGGTVATVGSDMVHTFSTDGTLVVQGSGTVSLLIVGRGNNGGAAFLNGGTNNDTNSGIGGAGGQVKYYESYSVSAGTYNVNITGTTSIFGIYATTGGGVLGGASEYMSSASYNPQQRNGYPGQNGPTYSITGTPIVYASSGGAGATSRILNGNGTGGAGGTGAGKGADVVNGNAVSNAGNGTGYGCGGGGGSVESYTTDTYGNPGNGSAGVVIIRYTPG